MKKVSRRYMLEIEDSYRMDVPMSKRSFLINKRKIAEFCKKYHVVYLALFGSVLTPHFKESSDVDVLVKFKKDHAPDLFNLVDMESELSSIMGRQVDLKTPNDLSPYFRSEVLSQSKIIYGK